MTVQVAGQVDIGEERLDASQFIYSYNGERDNE